MNSEEVEACVRKNIAWQSLPQSIKQQLGNSQREYEKCIVNLSMKNQLRFKGSLVEKTKKDETKYYEELIEYGKKSLVLFPYHLSDMVIKRLGITPFQYYIDMLDNQMAQEKSYDSLPNFTAADCLRLLGVGRNQYIDLMNACRSNRRFGIFRKSGRELLPHQPIEGVTILPWWYVQIAFITEEDMKNVDKAEHCLIDMIIDNGSCPAGHLNHQTVKELYRKGLIYFDVPIVDDDLVAVPPLEGFVMNRLQGDFFETLLYKIFVSIDEHTSVSELASILEIDNKFVRSAVSLYCRLGFAKKKNSEMDSNDVHPSWYNTEVGTASDLAKKPPTRTASVSSDEDDSLLKELNQALEVEDEDVADSSGSEFVKPDAVHAHHDSGSGSGQKKIGFLFDSTLTAYLMMGNLSVGLKTHAVTMFEVGKLSDESLDSLISELDRVSSVDGEGEAARYYSHARNLKSTIQFLRNNPCLKSDDDSMCLPLDLIRCESLQSLDPGTASRVLAKNYSLLVSMAPLANEIRPETDNFPPHLGPAIPEVLSVWFKLYLYQATGTGPPSLLLPKGYRLTRLPALFDNYSRLLVTTWGHEPSEIAVSGALVLLMDALQHSPVLVQAYCSNDEAIGDSETKHVPFPVSAEDDAQLQKDLTWWKTSNGHSNLPAGVDIRNNCGYISMIKLQPILQDEDEVDGCNNGDMNDEGADLLREEIDNLDTEKSQKPTTLDLGIHSNKNESQSSRRGQWTLLDIKYGIPLFDSELNKVISQRVTINSLWKPESLKELAKTGSELSKSLMAFIDDCLDLYKGDFQEPNLQTPDEKKRSPVPLPTKAVFFNGRKIQKKL